MSAKYLGTHDFTGATVLGVTATVENIPGVTVAGSGTSDVPSPDYSTLAAALLAGHRSIFVVGDTLETANPTVTTSGCVVRLMNEATVHIVAGSRVILAVPSRIEGNGTIMGADTQVIDIIGTDGRYSFDGITVDGRLQGTNDQLMRNAAGSRVAISDVTLILADALSTSRIEVRDWDATNLYVNGAGTPGSSNSERAFHFVGGRSQFKNIRFGPSFRTVGSHIPFNVVDVDAEITIDGVFFEGPPTPKILLSNRGRGTVRISNWSSDHAQSNITATPSQPVANFHMENCQGIFFADPSLPPTPVSDSTFLNVVASGSVGGVNAAKLFSRAEASRRNRYINCEQGDKNIAPSSDTLEVWGEDFLISGNVLHQDVTIAGSGHRVDGCVFKGDLTLLANTSGVIVKGCTVLGSFTDNGVDNSAVID
jgi:hypothetical protein